MSSVNPTAPGVGLAHGSTPRPGDDGRPFGAHIQMTWWKSLVIIAAIPLTLFVSQLGLSMLAGLVEDGDPLESTLTPMKLLAANLGTGLTALLAVVLLTRFSQVPWRSVFSSPRRFDPRRLATSFAGSVVLVGAGIALVAVAAPDATGWVGFGISGTTVALLAVVVFSTPIQSAGEEIMFRGAVLPAVGSWFHAVRPAFITGLVVSSLSFAVVHAASHPWLFGYYVFLSACTALMGLITRGLEAAMAFHIANNVVATTINALLAGGGTLVVDRTGGGGGGGGPELIVPAVVNLGVLAFVWHHERARRTDAE
ncbi:CPBP family intramembrane glutamic endopeptidase [Actinoplanes sp. M2I2]|uniref:CPBP family intramembrane glutamic endopeptidase n=1 Tax=Actinoplanes sp. M2I2 TaxID=1734444 RepID=UPI002020DE52|nr:type II CAAX endopeptidase family protein [Actinoplanes sp. M2I2]